MSIKKLIAILAAVIAVLGLLGAAYRWWELLPLPIGTGESKKSPNGLFEASVMDYYDESFWGYPRRWFQFEVRGGSPQRLITDPIPGPYFGSRSSHSVMSWADDSSSVRFVFPSVEITMKP